MSLNKFTARQLLNIEACTRCGACTDMCTAYNADKDLKISPAKKMELLKKRVRNNTLLGKLFFNVDLTEQQLKDLEEAAYKCTLCSRCEVNCPINIDLQKLWISLRESLHDDDLIPENLCLLKERLEKSRNVSFDTNEGRTDWIKQLPDLPDHGFVKEKAEVIYFVGCVSSFSPRVFKIPRSVAGILIDSKVDFSLLGDEEWCCGFPLLTSGYKKDFIDFAKHNIESVNKSGAKYLITSCPSCFHMWKHTYHDFARSENIKIQFEVLHVVQYISLLIKEGKIKLNPIEKKITYHDPCDLGRNSGIYKEPREIIKSIPGAEFIETLNNKENATCCGGGGNVESVDAELSANIAAIKAREIMETGADIVVTACQQCVRTITQALKKEKSKIKVMDISELVLMSMIGSEQG